jgi:outer membrane protein assembly factor BamA
MGRRAWIALATAALLHTLAAPGAAAPPMVMAIELSSSHPLPEQQVREVIGDLSGKALSRDAVRDAVERLWGLGLFSAIRVDEIPTPGGGIRLRYEFTQRLLIRKISWEGTSGIDLADAAAVAGLAIGEEAGQTRLARAEQDLLTRYHRDGYLGARILIRRSPWRAQRAGRHHLPECRRAGAHRGGAPRGDPGLPAKQIEEALKLPEGHPFRESLARDGARAAEERLRQDGYYEARVTAGPPDWHADSNRVDLDIRVSLGPRFRVEFEGRSALPESALKSALTFAASGAADAFEQESSARQLEAAYRERGYHFARVTPEARDGDVGVIRFVIDEGPRVTVESLTFSGAVTVPADQLEKEIETRRPSLFRRGLFREDLLDHDAGVVTAYLRSLGYAEASVGPPEVHFSEDRTRARVRISVSEGPRLTAGAVTIEGAHVFASSEIRAALPFKPGAPWEARQAEDGRRAIEKLYASRGYYGAAVRVDTSRHDSTVQIRYDIDEGGQTRIGRVLLRGLLLAREDVVRRTLPFRSGDVLLPDKLLDGQRRLGEFAAFDAVSIDPLRPPPNPFADVEVTLRERKPWHLDFGVGFSNAEGGRGFIELGHDDVFGTGASVSIRQRLSAGGDSTRWAERTDALGRVPFVLGTPWWVDVDIFQELSGQLGYDLAHAGIWVDAHRDLFPEWIKGLRGDLRYRLESVRYSNVDPTLARGRRPTRVVVSVTPMFTSIGGTGVGQHDGFHQSPEWPWLLGATSVRQGWLERGSSSRPPRRCHQPGGSGWPPSQERRAADRGRFFAGGHHWPRLSRGPAGPTRCTDN